MTWYRIFAALYVTWVIFYVIFDFVTHSWIFGTIMLIFIPISFYFFYSAWLR